MTIKQVYSRGKTISDILCETFGFDKDYTDHLFKQDDWTTVIVYSALIEACLGSAISARLECAEIDGFVHSLGVRGKNSKISLARALGIIEKNDEKFLSAFFDMRNAFVHKQENVKITFQQYFSQEGADKLDKLESALVFSEVRSLDAGSIGTGHLKTKAGSEFKKNKREVILANLVHILIMLSNATEHSRKLWDSMQIEERKKVNQGLRDAGKIPALLVESDGALTRCEIEVAPELEAVSVIPKRIDG